MSADIPSLRLGLLVSYMPLDNLLHLLWQLLFLAQSAGTNVVLRTHIASIAASLALATDALQKPQPLPEAAAGCQCARPSRGHHY